MPKHVLYVDFDRTLFDTQTFFTDLWQWLGDEYGLDGQAEQQRANEFYTMCGTLYDYDFFTHIDACGLARTDVEQRAKQALTGPYLYQDAQYALALRPIILTFGNSDYQRFKLSFCDLADYTTIIIQESKGDYIARHHPRDSVTLVDDKDLIAELPPQVHFIRIDRTQPRPHTHVRERYDTIASLQYIEEVMT